MKRTPTILFAVLALVLSVSAQNKPRVFVTDEPINEGNLIVRGNAAAGHVESGANARTVELQADLVKLCPRVTVTSRYEAADFVLLFRREGGKRSSMFAFGGLAGLALSSASKVDGASLFDVNGDLVTATKQRTVERAMSEVCTHIPATVTHMAAQQPVAPVAQPLVAQTPAALAVAQSAPPAYVKIEMRAPVADATLSTVVTPQAPQEESLGNIAMRNKQHADCLKLAANNPSINCQ
jgi:hypothetical protein